MRTELATREPEAVVQPSVVQAPTQISPMEMHELIPRMELARRLPRSPVVFAKRLREEVALDPAPMVYRKPGKDEDNKPISIIGPSIRMAEIAGRLFGNLDISSPVIVEEEAQVTATVQALDLESNYRVPGTASISLMTKYGKRMPGHVVSNLRMAAAAKAMRNAVEKIVGKHVLKEMVELCLKATAAKAGEEMRKGGGKEAWWKRSVAWWSKVGISEADLFRALKVQGLDAVTTEHAAWLNASSNSVKQEGTPPRVALGLEDEPPPPPAEDSTDPFPFDEPNT